MVSTRSDSLVPISAQKSRICGGNARISSSDWRLFNSINFAAEFCTVGSETGLIGEYIADFAVFGRLDWVRGIFSITKLRW
jgi:hypothetical protein